MLLAKLGFKLIFLQVQASGQTRPTALTDLVDESDIDKWSSEENDLREARQGNYAFLCINGLPSLREANCDRLSGFLKMEAETVYQPAFAAF